jgi:hypothetical protein
MNIHASSPNPRKCARALDDVRLRKMVLETAQMLCTVLNLRAGEQVTPYRNSHATNKLVLWASKRRNYHWLWRYGFELGEEYHRRFGKAHASFLVIQNLVPFWGRQPPGEPRSFCNAASSSSLGLNFLYEDNVHKAYRAYMTTRWVIDSTVPKAKSKKIVPPKWTACHPPKWAKVAR